jgi:hypothetical protein
MRHQSRRRILRGPGQRAGRGDQTGGKQRNSQEQCEKTPAAHENSPSTKATTMTGAGRSDIWE